MRIDPAIAARQWERAAVEQLELDLAAKGFDVEREARIGDVVVDILAKRGGEKILFEVKTPGAADPSLWTKSLVRLQSIAKEIGAKFQLVVVRVPYEASIHIDGLESAIETYLVEQTPDVIRAIAPNVAVLDVDGIQLTSLNYNDGFDLAGRGDILLSLPEQGINVNIPFSFEGAFDLSANGGGAPLRMRSLKAFDIDASMVA